MACTLFLFPILWWLGARAEAVVNRREPAVVSKASIVAHLPNYAEGRQVHGLYRWRHLPVHVYFAPFRDDPHGRYRELVLGGFDEWARATGGALWYEETDDPQKAQVTVTFLPGSYVPPSPTTLGRTNFLVLGSFLQKAEMTLAIGDCSPEEITESAAHEWGHALGIDGHSESEDDLMCAVTHHYRSNDPHYVPPPTRQVSRRDRNTIEAAYPDLFPRHKADNRNDD